MSEGTIQLDDDLAAVLGRRVGDVWVAPDGRVVPPNYGKHDNEGDALQDLVERLVSQLDPQMIWLFGSRARGDARQDSDFDLLVVAKHGGSFGTDDYERVRYPTIGAGIDAEVVPCSLSDFAEALELKTSFVSHVTRTGRLVHGGMPS